MPAPVTLENSGEPDAPLFPGQFSNILAVQLEQIKGVKERFWRLAACQARRGEP